MRHVIAAAAFHLGHRVPLPPVTAVRGELPPHTRSRPSVRHAAPTRQEVEVLETGLRTATSSAAAAK